MARSCCRTTSEPGVILITTSCDSNRRRERPPHLKSIWIENSNQFSEEVVMLAAGKAVGLTIDNIVVATDFGPAAEAATEDATSIAKHFSSKLTLVNVVDLSVATRSEAAMAGWPLEQMREDSAAN